ncbi:MAG: dTDP-4-dehydrorhamnose reductase [Treponema sp.]|nr:dTDP-4-dehydrorhamnose reductase [Treponema sp.]
MIWLIGSKGMLGSEVAEELSSRGFLWIGSGSEVDITNPRAIENFITSSETQNYLDIHIKSKDPMERKIKWIINCAAYTAVDNAEDDVEKATAVNATGALHIARSARNHGAKLIHISTDYVFDGKSSVPYKENDAKNPTGVYGKTKSDGEDAICSAMTQYYIIRTAWLYGFYGKNFVRTMIKLFNEKDSIKVVSDQTGSPTCARDLASTIVTLIEKSQKATSIFGKNSALSYGIYHFTNKGKTTWFEFAKKIYELGKKCGKVTGECKILPCTTDEFGAKAPRPAFSVLCKEKIEKELHIKIPSWEQSLKTFLNDKRFIV